MMFLVTADNASAAWAIDRLEEEGELDRDHRDQRKHELVCITASNSGNAIRGMRMSPEDQVVFVDGWDAYYRTPAERLRLLESFAVSGATDENCATVTL